MNISRFHGVPASELGPVFEHLRSTTNAQERGAVASLFENRALGLIRNGSSTQLRDEGAALNRFLYSRMGREFEERDHALSERLKTIADLVARAGQRNDAAFVASVLSSHKKYAQPMIEFLWRAGEPVPRQTLLRELGIEESHLSHILRDLEDADVIARIRWPGTKEVRISLAPTGRDLVKQQLVPAWFLSAMKFIQDAVHGLKTTSAEIAERLLQDHVPSRLVADHVEEVIKLIGGHAPAKAADVRPAVASQGR